MNKYKGFTLVEVVVAVLVAGIAVVSVFTVIVSTFTSAPKSDRKETAGLILKQANEQLKAYAARSYAIEKGDALMLSHFPASLTGICDETDPMSAGDHDITCLLDDTILEDGTLTYTVSNVPPAGELLYKKVDFSLQLP